MVRPPPCYPISPRQPTSSLQVDELEGVSFHMRRYSQFLNRQLRRHALAVRTRRFDHPNSRFPTLPGLTTLRQAAHRVSRYYRRSVLRHRRDRIDERRPVTADSSNDDRPGWKSHLPCAHLPSSPYNDTIVLQQRQRQLGPPSANTVHRHHSNSANCQSPCTPQRVPSNAGSSRSLRTSYRPHYSLNRQLRHFILQQRRSASRPGHATPSSTQKRNYLLVSTREGQNSPRSELFRTRRVPKKPSPPEPVFYDLGNPDQSCDHCGAVVWLQERTNNTNLRARPKYSVCCSGGSVQLPLLQEPPSFLKYLMESSEREAVIFRKNMRPYNSIFAFTSIGARIDNSVNDGRGPYVFRLNGLNYHQIGSLLPPPNQAPRFAQLYFYDTENEVSNRMRALSGGQEIADLDESIIERLVNMFNTHNPLAQAFKTARERFAESNLIQVRLRLIGSRQTDGRQHNLPTASEVAAVIVGNEPNKGHSRDIIVENRALGLQRISEVHPSFMALQYPLLFPYGEDGYMPGILTRNASHLSTDDDTISYR